MDKALRIEYPEPRELGDLLDIMDQRSFLLPRLNTLATADGA
jgi:hypothetical protein